MPIELSNKEKYSIAMIVACGLWVMQTTRGVQWPMGEIAMASTEQTAATKPVYFEMSIDQSVIACADQSGISTLSAMEIQNQGRMMTLNWISEPNRGTVFLSCLESKGVISDRIQITSRGWSLRAHPGKKRDFMQPAEIIGNPFRQVKSKRSTPAKRKLTRKQREAQRMKQELKRIQEAENLEARRIEGIRDKLSRFVTLSAMMNTGGGNMAMVNIQNNGTPRSQTIEVGDHVLGGRVTSINDRSGEVQFDIEGKAHVVLRMPQVQP